MSPSVSLNYEEIKKYLAIIEYNSDAIILFEPIAQKINVNSIGKKLFFSNYQEDDCFEDSYNLKSLKIEWLKESLNQFIEQDKKEFQYKKQAHTNVG